MSEGGVYPWKVQKVRLPRNGGRPGRCGFAELSRPLPSPPDGQMWVRDDATREWRLVSMSPDQCERARPVNASPSPRGDPPNEQVQMMWVRGPSPGELELAPIVPGTCRRIDGAAQNASATQRNPGGYWAPPDGEMWVHDESSGKWRLVPLAKATAIVGTSSDESESRADASTSVCTAVPIKAGDPSTSNEAATAKKQKAAACVHYHKVLHTDTFQGICLKYKVTPTVLRRANKMLGNNLKLAPETLFIPMNEYNMNVDASPSTPEMIEEEKIASLRCQVAGVTKNELSWKEARVYLHIAGWDLERAASEVRADFEWSVNS